MLIFSWSVSVSRLKYNTMYIYLLVTRCFAMAHPSFQAQHGSLSKEML